jgi:hypothetical protein
LFGQGCEVLLPAGKRVDFPAGGALEVHSEPHWPDEHVDHACRDVLRYLAALLASEVLDFFVIRLDLGVDRWTIGIAILRLHNGNGLRRPSSTTGYCGEQQDADTPAEARLDRESAGGYALICHKGAPSSLWWLGAAPV